MRIKYGLVVWVGLCMCVACLSACGKPPVQAVVPETLKETLQFRITWKAYSGRGEAIQRIVDVYNSRPEPRYTVMVVDGDEDSQALGEALDTKAANDLYVLPYRYVQYFGAKDKLLDLTPYFEKDQQAYYETIWRLGEVKDQVYGIPWFGHSMCLLYNEKLLKNAGVDGNSITDMPSLLAAMDQVEAKTAAKGIGLVGADHNDVSWMVNQFIYGYGSRLVDETGHQVVVNNEQSRKAIEFYKNVLGSYAQPTWKEDTGVEVMEAFRQQQVAFEFQGIWGITDIWKNGKPFEVGVVSLDTLGLCSEVGPMMVALPAGISPEKRDGAVDFIRFLISPEAQEKIMDGEYSPEHDAYYPFRVPVRKELTQSLVFQKYPTFIPFLLGFENPSIDVPVPAWQLVKEKVYAPGLHQVMTDKMTIEAFLEKVEKEGNIILNSDSK